MNLQALCSLTLLALCSCSRVIPPSSSSSPLTIERLYGSPSLGGSLPRSTHISKDGKKITFLKAKAKDRRVFDLWEFDVKSGRELLLIDSDDFEKATLSQEEKANRERRRISTSGITNYIWSPTRQELLLPIEGELYLYRFDQKPNLIKLTHNKDYELDPTFSPQGNYVSFVKNYNVYVIELSSLKEKQITFSGSKDKTIGMADFISQEEIDRFKGYWWSKDEKFIAAIHVDLTPVSRVKRFEIDAKGVQVIKQRYPKTGEKNASSKLKLFSVQTPKYKALWTQPETDYEYIPSVKWRDTKKDQELFYTLQSRDQTTLKLMRLKTKDFSTKKILTESDPAWVNIRHDFILPEDSNLLYWPSENSGFFHIQKVIPSTGQRTPLTSGKGVVNRIKGVRENKLYFMGNIDTPLENHLYSVNLSGAPHLTQVTREPGTHYVDFDKKAAFFLDYFSTPSQPFSLAAKDFSGKLLFHLAENKIEGNHPLKPYQGDLQKWEYFSVKGSKEGDLRYKVLKPKKFSKSKKYPVIQYVYGGPLLSLVNKSWSTRDLYFQILAEKGFVVIVGDNRGTPGRGRDFERAIKNNFGKIDIEDQTSILQDALKNIPGLDPSRIGVYGHSYGGYLSLMLLLQRPNTYKAAVAGAPVTDWRVYDTHYTERYMGMPQDNKKAYDHASVLNHIEKLKGRLLLVHGMADDNVLYSNSLLLAEKLQAQEKTFDFMSYPGAKHGIRQKTSWRVHYNKMILEHFIHHL